MKCIVQQFISKRIVVIKNNNRIKEKNVYILIREDLFIYTWVHFRYKGLLLFPKNKNEHKNCIERKNKFSKYYFYSHWYVMAIKVCRYIKLIFWYMFWVEKKTLVPTNKQIKAGQNKQKSLADFEPIVLTIDIQIILLDWTCTLSAK